MKVEILVEVFLMLAVLALLRDERWGYPVLIVGHETNPYQNYLFPSQST
jgi:hypothetical protein